MENLKHTIVAGLAVTMIASLAAAQGSSIKSALADNVSANSVDTVSQYVWDDNLISIDSKLYAMNELKNEVTTTPAVNTSVTANTHTKLTSDIGYVILSEGTLNVRQSASTDAEVIDKLNCGDKVTVLETLVDWYKISYGEDGKTGYVSSLSITGSEEEAKEAALKSFMYETGVAVVTDGALNIRSGAGTDFEVINQIDNGDKVIILNKGDEWLKVYFGRNYEVGYVNAASINITGMVSRDEVAKTKKERIVSSAKCKGKISVSSGAVNVRSSASDNGEVISQLYNKDDILIFSTNSGWTKIAFGQNNTIGYVKSDYIVDPTVPSRSGTTSRTTDSSTAKSSKSSGSSKSAASKSSNSEEKIAPLPKSASSSAKGQALVNQAAKYLGTKYVYGGSSPSGFDCSGLVQYSCRQLGISVSRSSREQFNNGVPVSKSDLQPGDLVFFKRNGVISHVGIYAGNGQMIHSPQTGKTVCYTSITSGSRASSYAGARRVTG